MRGRKPKGFNIVPLVVTGRAARTAAVQREVKRLQPAGLPAELRREWTRVASILADPAVDRLRPTNVDTIVEYCRASVRLRNLRAFFDRVAEERAAATGEPIDRLDAEIYRLKGQLKAHPHVRQLNESWHQWRSLTAALGLSPSDARGMAPGRGEQFDGPEGEFA
jgi:P27 family predicted phage terminase small subunit